MEICGRCESGTFTDGTCKLGKKPILVPYYLQKPVKSDKFENVPSGTPLQWCSPLVVIPKPEFSNEDQDKLESHIIRACANLRILNKFLEQNIVIQSPVVEDFKYKFHKCKIFR
ncbi:Hypothetical predicted protein [Mytilus galloprovincialis]|uniref:Uncharacterized protein n=1 Tax=Mytilus galloprovincialis TaxID=29158 RepID=A0A8B6HPW0_MYTGA|nr:Hypothetical predicted protein [Mytilus galloprovincialis]